MKCLLVASVIALTTVGTISSSSSSGLPLFAEARKGGAVKRPQVVRTHRNVHNYDHTELELPDLNSQKGTMTMSCTTCTEVVGDIWDQLHPTILQNSDATAQAGGRPVRKNAYIEVVDKACLHLDNKYGLAIDDRTGKATHAMSGDEGATRLRGKWVNRYVRKECARIIRAAHERIVHHINDFKNETDFATKVCVDWTNACPLIKQKPTHPALKYRTADL